MLEIALLGEQALRNGRVLRTRSSRSLALVAYLALHGGLPQARQRIAAAFWPDSTDDQALTNLRRELHHLRQVLDGEPSLLVTGKDLCWRDAETCRVDVRTFVLDHRTAVDAMAGGDADRALDAARRAVDTYRGEFLPGAYDEWVLDARADLEQRCVELLDLVADLSIRHRDLAAAAVVLRRRIQYRPLEETGYRLLIDVQGELGDRAGAVSTYHHCASVLERALGIDPDPTTRASFERVLTRAGPAGDPPAVPAPQRARSGVAAVGLVGRRAELALLSEVWTAARAGRPGLALVRGEPGVGKTRLVAELAELARSTGAVVAGAQSFGTAGRLALSPVADWLRTPAIQAGLAELDPVWRAEVERLVPTVRGRGEPGPSMRAMIDAWQRHRFFEGVARALFTVGRPLLLLLDNLQWCDQETLAFLTFCLGLADDVPIMVAATVRTDDHPSGLAEWTARMRATGMVTDVALAPLDDADTVELAAAVSGLALPPADLALLRATTGGFPLYIVEAARRGPAREGTATREATAMRAATEVRAGDLRTVLCTRLEELTPTARRVAGLAAAVGRDFTLDLLTESGDLPAHELVAGIDELWRHRILSETGDGYDFSHDLLRDVAYEQVTPPQRWLLHRRIAQGLERVHADDPDAVSAQLAEQYARGGRGDRATAYYRRAADVAARRFAHDEAIRLQTEALTLVRRRPAGRTRDGQELSILEAMAAPLNARYGYASPRVRDVLERAAVLADGLGRRESLVSALVSLWASHFVRGYALDAHRGAMRALTLVEPGSEFAGAAHFAVGGSAVSLGQPVLALEHLDIATTLGDAPLLTIGTRSDVHGLAFAAHAHWLMGHDAQAVAASEAAITLARAADTPYSLAVALAYAGLTQQLRCDVPATRAHTSELRELCDRYDFAYYREWATILDGWCRPDGTGLDLVRRGVDNLIAQGSFARMPYWLAIVADVAERAGRPGTARARLDGALAAGAARHDVWWLPEVMRRRAAYDPQPMAVARLQAALALATSQGSVALADRCAADLPGVGDPGGLVDAAAPALCTPVIGVRRRPDGDGVTRNAARTARS